MPSPRVTRGRELAAQLTAAGCKATADVRKVAGSTVPIVLVRPPRLEFDVAAGATATWTLLVVPPNGDEHTAWTQIDELLHALETALPLDRAEPAFWGEQNTRPAYAATYTETVES